MLPWADGEATSAAVELKGTVRAMIHTVAVMKRAGANSRFRISPKLSLVFERISSWQQNGFRYNFQ